MLLRVGWGLGRSGITCSNLQPQSPIARVQEGSTELIPSTSYAWNRFPGLEVMGVEAKEVRDASFVCLRRMAVGSQDFSD